MFEEINPLLVKKYSILCITYGDLARYLVYYDKDWDCWFFPNFKTSDRGNVANLVQQTRKVLCIDISGHIRRLYWCVHYKYSEPTKSVLPYEHTLYLCRLEEQPQIPDDYKWMSLSEMLSDERIRSVNGDVIAMIQAGLSQLHYCN